MQTVYLFTKDCGDGSRSIVAVSDPQVVAEIKELADDDLWHYENGFGVYGDGFHYMTMYLPEDLDLDTLGISFWDAEDLKQWKEDYL